LLLEMGLWAGRSSRQAERQCPKLRASSLGQGRSLLSRQNSSLSVSRDSLLTCWKSRGRASWLSLLSI
jgi:hypothetical protein